MARGKVNGQPARAHSIGRADRTHTAPFGLIDVESGNMVGSFASEHEALLAVAETARDYGVASDAVLSLSLFRDDVPAGQGFIADGEELVRRALAAAEIGVEA